MNGSKLMLWTASVLLSMLSLESLAHETRDKTSRCLKMVDWETNAFGALDDPDEIFIAAEAFDELVDCVHQGEASPRTPAARIVHRGIVYIRSPAYAGACDEMRKNAIRFAWCTGARGPSTNDPKLIACQNQYCDFSVDDTRRRYGGR